MATLCTPRMSLRHPERCSALGPGGKLAAWSRMGLLPERPLPTVPLDPSVRYLPFSYLEVDSKGIPIYPSLEAAQNRGAPARTLAPGFLHLSYQEEIESQGEVFFRLEAGGVVRGDRVARIEPPRFEGLQFQRTPERPFGWVISGTFTYRSPSEGAQLTDHWRPRFDVIQIYASEEVDGESWYLVGREEWIPAKWVAIVEPDPTRPQGVTGDRWITVNLFEQTVAAYHAGELIYATLASTGRYGAWTQPGTFQVWARLERDEMTGGVPGEEGYYYLADVPWVMYFDQARALHGTYWHAKFGYTSSRGCVNLTPTDARWFFQFAEEGTWVHVFDPSGQTPTDPSLYGPGGA
jgi:hypothetical protein